MTIEILSREECAVVLSANHTASLACVRDGRPYVIPISYAYSESFIYSFSEAGQKMTWMRDNKAVSLLVVDHRAGSAWESVIITGSFEEFTADAYFDYENERAWKALSKRADWWDPGSLMPVGDNKSAPASYIYYCIRIDQMTGRAARDRFPAQTRIPASTIRYRRE